MNELKRLVYRESMISCELCHNAPCSQVCEKLDPAGKLRSIWFDNDRNAARLMPEEFPCATCEAPCEDACVNKVPIKHIMGKLDGIMRNRDLHSNDTECLKTDFFGFRMINPFMLSSSVVGSTYDMCARAFDAGWGGAAFKTICLMDIHEASPRFAAVRDDSGTIYGFKNIEQLSDHTLPENLDTFRRLKEKYPDRLLIASIMGRDENEWAFLSKALEEAGADALELNFSCPNMTAEGTGSDVGQIPELVEKYTRIAKENCSIPVLAKLTPNVMTMSPAAEAAMRGGADGIAAINTIKSLIVTDEGKIAVGGLSGKAVKPIALRFIAELGENENLKGMHISAMGGIETWRDAAEFIGYGAKTVQITTAVMQYGYRIIEDLTEGLATYLNANSLTMDTAPYHKLRQVVDIEEIERDIVIYPKFERIYCSGCGRCYISCMDGGHQAITLGEDRKPILDPKKCVGCHLCILVCPEECIVSSGRPIKKQ